MPTAPKTHRPAHVVTAKRDYDRDRGTPLERGYSKRWAAYARGFRREQVFCETCLLHGREKIATCVDHIVAVAGPQDDLFWEPTNHQPLCHACHSRKTTTIDGGFGHGARRWHPARNRFVVCGLPATGKTTWVRERARPQDQQWDADEVVNEMFGHVAHPWPEHVMQAVVDRRTAFLRQATQQGGSLYVIVASVETAIDIAKDISANVVHLCCPEHERQERLEQMRMRGVRK